MRTQQVEEAAHLAATQGSVGGKPDTEPDRARAAESPRTAHYDGVRIDARERIINSLSLSLNSAEIVQVWTLSSSPIPRLGLSFFFLSFGRKTPEGLASDWSHSHSIRGHPAHLE